MLTRLLQHSGEEYLDEPSISSGQICDEHFWTRQKRTRRTRMLLSSPPVASLYDCDIKSFSCTGRALLIGTGWKSHELMGLLSCQRISSVLTRISRIVGETRSVRRICETSQMLKDVIWALIILLPN